MDMFRQVLDTPFPPPGWEQQLLAITAVFFCVAAAICSVVLVARSSRRTRLQERRVVGRPVRITWRDGVGIRDSDDGFCQDFSRGGAALDLPFPLKVRTRLHLRMSEARLSGSGVVRRCTRVGRRYMVGVEFDPLTRSLANH